MSRLAVCLFATALAACEGTVSLSITDAPADEVARAVVRVTAIEFNRSDGGNERVELDEPLDIDLAALSEGRSQTLLNDEELPIGDYSAVELEIEAQSQELDSFIELAEDGAQIPLVLDSGVSLRASRAFTIEDEESIALTLDFDLRRSLTSRENDAGDRILVPALRVVIDEDTGSITGQVDADLLDDGDCDNGDDHDEGNVAYLFSGSGVNPDDIDELSPEPLSTARIRANAASGEAEFTLAFIEEGDYTLAISCQGLLDDPETDDDIAFIDSMDVSVEADETTTADF